jgi:hypothetical protein
MSSVKAGVMAALGTVLVTSLLFGAGFVVVKKTDVLARFTGPKAAPAPARPRKLLPVVDEEEATVGKPLLVLWDQYSRDDRSHDFEKVLLSRLRHRKFEELETYADEIRSSKLKLIGGQWVLGLFYGALDTPSEGRDSADAQWEAHVALLQEWRKAFPESITPHVAYAEAMDRWAWDTRGSKYAREVTDEQWKSFNQHLDAAVNALLEAKDIRPMDPNWFSAMLSIGRGQNWDREDYMKVFNSGIQFEPTYGSIYYQTSITLLPRWGGDTGEWAAVLSEATDKQGTAEAYAVYHRTFSNMAYNMIEYKDLTPELRKDWPQIKRGYHAREKLYGLPNSDINTHAHMAYLMQDQDEARQAFNLIGTRADEDAWEGDMKLYERARAWAAANN